MQAAEEIKKRMETKFEIYIPSENKPSSADALICSLEGLDLDKSYSEMMRLRTSGGAADECKDIYYICTNEHGELVSRLWMGWGRHEGAVGNWGNFFTSEACRGQGIGRMMIEVWRDDLLKRDDLPRALFCTASPRHILFYSGYGWRPAMKGADGGPLYLPLGDSPESFDEFCEGYYKSASSLIFKPATLEWRHEIDCLFKFAMMAHGLDYLPDGMESLEAALLAKDDKVEIIFTDTGIPVGLAYLKDNGEKDIKIHPNYAHLI